jgi:hypothetical protein
MSAKRHYFPAGNPIEGRGFPSFDVVIAVKPTVKVMGTAEVRRAPIGPGLRPGPRPCGWRGRPVQCAAYRPRGCDPFAQRLAHLARDDRPGQLARLRHALRVTAGCAARPGCGVTARRAAARDGALSRKRKRPSCPHLGETPPPLLAAPARNPHGPFNASSCMSRARCEYASDRSAWRRRCALETVEKAHSMTGLILSGFCQIPPLGRFALSCPPSTDARHSSAN